MSKLDYRALKFHRLLLEHGVPINEVPPLAATLAETRDMIEELSLGRPRIEPQHGDKMLVFGLPFVIV